jgi:Mismatch repair ATPase (MutS family)
VSRRLAAILKQAKMDGYVEADASVAVRDGRAVIPVPAAYKRKLGGIVHDESATGRTSYIEPTRWWSSTTNCASWNMPNVASW